MDLTWQQYEETYLSNFVMHTIRH